MTIANIKKIGFFSNCTRDRTSVQFRKYLIRHDAVRRVTAIAKAILESTERVFALIKRAQLRERDLRGGVSVENSRISL